MVNEQRIRCYFVHATRAPNTHSNTHTKTHEDEKKKQFYMYILLPINNKFIFDNNLNSNEPITSYYIFYERR